MSITAELDKAEAQRDILVSGIRQMLYRTVTGTGLSGTLSTANGKNTEETVQQALLALEEFIKRDKAHWDEHGKMAAQLDALRAEKRTIQAYFGGLS